MTQPRFRRRKADRPREITEAALVAFADNGFAATRVNDVAKRAGVSKGLLYRYFRTKDELFKAVVRRVISPRIEALRQDIEHTELTAAEYLRGPFLAFAKKLPRSPARVLVRLMIVEGARYPELTAWYRDNVIEHGLAALRQLIERGVRNGEFRESAMDEFPHLLVAPVLFSVVWALVFDRHEKLDTDSLIAGHVDLVLRAIGTGSETAAGDRP